MTLSTKLFFPNTNLKEDNKGAGTWGTDLGAENFCGGCGSRHHRPWCGFTCH